MDIKKQNQFNHKLTVIEDSYYEGVFTVKQNTVSDDLYKTVLSNRAASAVSTWFVDLIGLKP